MEVKERALLLNPAHFVKFFKGDLPLINCPVSLLYNGLI
jgi:hypothetical protein